LWYSGKVVKSWKNNIAVTKHTKEKSKYFILENGGWYLGFVARRIQIGWFLFF
jgi:hypothetical protein